GVFLTIWKQFSERKWDREQREVESRRRMDEKFTAIVADVGSENTSTQVSAIISIMTFLKDEYASFHEQVFLILLANLKVQHKPQVNRLLIQAFAKAIRLYLTSSDCTDRTNRLGEYDFTYTHLYRINLSNLDLSNIDLAFAQMELANLENSNLFRMKGYKANLKKAQFTDANMGEARLAKANLEGAHFHRVNLVSSNLKETNLQKAQFFQAKLQSAHLEKADLNGARFEEADINDAYFYDACFDSSTIKSIRRAYNWEKAHFDDDVFERLNELR
ncbi:MAG: pentapeptide repeat-containing protein, partial [Deltaproteobacteria bacterium]|nr:pentapeptide repeat-containing protein [Deltaproteobacteria bacterium]